jgi:hypothetical protein
MFWQLHFSQKIYLFCSSLLQVVWAEKAAGRTKQLTGGNRRRAAACISTRDTQQANVGRTCRLIPREVLRPSQ